MGEAARLIDERVIRLESIIKYLEKEFKKLTLTRREEKEINDSINLTNDLVKEIENNPNADQRTLMTLRTRLIEVELERENWPLK